jgi:hypothetical protein
MRAGDRSRHGGQRIDAYGRVVARLHALTHVNGEFDRLPGDIVGVMVPEPVDGQITSQRRCQSLPGRTIE